MIAWDNRDETGYNDCGMESVRSDIGKGQEYKNAETDLSCR